MGTIKSIGNIGDMIAPRRLDGVKKPRPKKKLSELLREERQLLFGKEKKKTRRNTTHSLPRAIRSGSNTVKAYKEDEIVLALTNVIDYLRKRKIKDIESLGDLAHPDNRYWQLYVCYIVYQCFDINAQHIAAYFNMTRDITTQTHRLFKKEIEHGGHNEEEFLNVFDYFMQLNKMDYI